jgi:hypothetical protein
LIFPYFVVEVQAGDRDRHKGCFCFSMPYWR